MGEGVKIMLDGPAGILDYMPLRGVLEVLRACQVLLNAMSLTGWQEKDSHLFPTKVRNGDHPSRLSS